MTRQQATNIGIFIFGLIALAAIGLSFFEQLGCEGQLLNHEFTPTKDQQILGERVVSQSFVAPRDGLEQISIMFLTYQRQNTHDVEFRLLEVPAGLDNPLLGIEVFRSSFNAGQVSDQEWIGFKVGPILDSAGKQYLISLQSPDSQPGDALAAGGMQKDAYKPGLAYLGPVPLPADMTFATCYDLSLTEKLGAFSEQLTRSRPWVWGDTGFYVFCFSVYIVLLVVFSRLIVKIVGR